MTFTITEPLVRKLLTTVDAGLVRGLGKPKPGQMCVEAAISFALGEPHGDGPSCVESVVRAAKIALNDFYWSSAAARAAGLRRVAIAQLGSRGVVDPNKFARLLAVQTIRWIVPIALRAAANQSPRAKLLEAAAERCHREGDATSVAEARHAAAGHAAAYSCAVAAGNAYANANLGSGYTYAADAATQASVSAATYAAEADTEASNADGAGDTVLGFTAELMVGVLRECGSPGCEWLWLTEAAR